MAKAAKAAKNPAPAEIEFDGVLPRWREDDVAFLCALLRTSYGLRLVTIAQVVSDLHFQHASDDADKPRSPEYYRIRRAFHEARSRGLLRRSGIRWGLASASGEPSAK